MLFEIRGVIAGLGKVMHCVRAKSRGEAESRYRRAYSRREVIFMEVKTVRK